MTSYTPSGTRTAEQERWSNYYLTRDLDQARPALLMLGNSARVRPGVNCDSTAVDAVLPQITVPQAAQYTEYTQHHPVDTRSKAEQRVNRTRYSRAKAYYGKTYIIPRSQMIWAGLIGFGSALAVGASTAITILHSFN